MDSVPQTPDQQTRNAVTQRITAHVTASWPRLGEPLVRYHGQYCYVDALLPGHREPTPFSSPDGTIPPMPIPSLDHAVPPMPSEVTNGHDRMQRPAAGGMWGTAMMALRKMMH